MQSACVQQFDITFIHKIDVTFFVLCIYFIVPCSLFGQRTTITHTLLTRDLIRQGYEDIIARTHERATLVQYEDSKNRYPTDGIQEIVGRTSLLLPPTNKKVVIVLTKYAVPLVVFESADFASYYSRRRQREMIIPRLYASDRSDYW